jgi:hypothetical protein
MRRIFVGLLLVTFFVSSVNASQAQTQIFLSQSTYILYADMSEAQLYRVDSETGVFEIKADPTDRVLLHNGYAYISQDHTEVYQLINGSWHTFNIVVQPLGTELPQHSLYLSLVTF